MHTIKTQTVFIRPEQYKDCMDLSLMLAWNAQCEPGQPKRMLNPQREVFAIDKLRGHGVGTGDAKWKGGEEARLRAQFAARDAEKAKDKKIDSLTREISTLRAAQREAQRSAEQAASMRTAVRYPKSNTLVPSDPPVAALEPHRVGSPGAAGVRKQLAQQSQEHRRLMMASGQANSSAYMAGPSRRRGLPDGFHDPPTRTIGASHKAMSVVNPWNHHQTPGSIDYRSIPEFTPTWRDPAPTAHQRHTIRDLA